MTQVGNVKNESLLQIWNGEHLRRLRLLHLTGYRSENKACKNCDQLPSFRTTQKNTLLDLSKEEFLRKEEENYEKNKNY